MEQTAGKAEFGDKTVLEGAPKPFNAPLGLGRVSSDELDTQLGHRPAELRIRAAFSRQRHIKALR